MDIPWAVSPWTWEGLKDHRSWICGLHQTVWRALAAKSWELVNTCLHMEPGSDSRAKARAIDRDGAKARQPQQFKSRFDRNERLGSLELRGSRSERLPGLLSVVDLRQAVKLSGPSWPGCVNIGRSPRSHRGGRMGKATGRFCKVSAKSPCGRRPLRMCSAQTQLRTGCPKVSLAQMV